MRYSHSALAGVWFIDLAIFLFHKRLFIPVASPSAHGKAPLSSRPLSALRRSSRILPDLCCRTPFHIRKPAAPILIYPKSAQALPPSARRPLALYLRPALLPSRG